MEKISIVIPCYNEEECIEIYYNEMQKIVSKLGTMFEYVFVDDGSRDKTISIIKRLGEKDSNIRYISFSRNFGKEAAIYAGLKAATGDYVGLMDVDLQDPPHLVLEMFDGIKNEGYDCVASRRTTRKGEPKLRSFFARVFYKLINKISDAEITDGARDFRLMTRPMVDAIISMSERDRFSKGIFGWVGFKIKWLEYENIDRVAGKTKWSFRSLFKYAVGGIEDFSSVPLKITKYISVILFLLSIAFSIYIGITFNKFTNFSKGTLLICNVMGYFTSLILFSLAVLSAYVKKIYKEAKGRPIYIVKEANTYNH